MRNKLKQNKLTSTYNKGEEIFFRILMNIFSYSILVILGVILLAIFYRGLSHISWNMIFTEMGTGLYLNRGGGIWNAIVGSLYLSLGATLIALVVGSAAALCMNVYLVRYPKLLHFVRFLLDLIWGVPSVVYGALALSVMVYFGARPSLFAGIVTVSLFILPIMIRALDEVMCTVPRELSESVLSMGAKRSFLSYVVYIRQCVPGLITAMLLAFGRAIGDAASVLYVTGENVKVPTGLGDRVTTLPVAIYNQINSPCKDVQEQAFASAFVLTLIIICISLISRYISRNYGKYKIS